MANIAPRSLIEFTDTRGCDATGVRRDNGTVARPSSSGYGPRAMPARLAMLTKGWPDRARAVSAGVPARALIHLIMYYNDTNRGNTNVESNMAEWSNASST